jgi:hypothetical protein
MNKKLYDLLEDIYLEYQKPTNLEKSLSNNFINFLKLFSKVWNSSLKYFDFKEEGILKEIFKTVVKNKTEKEKFRLEIISFKQDAISFIEVILEDDIKDKIDPKQDGYKEIVENFNTKYKPIFEQILKDLKDNKSIQIEGYKNPDVFFMLFFNEIGESNLFSIFDWSIRTRITDKLEKLDEFNTKFRKFAKMKMIGR